MVGLFTPWKLSHVVNREFFFFLEESVVKHEQRTLGPDLPILFRFTLISLDFEHIIHLCSNYLFCAYSESGMDKFAQ